ncbi:MAG: hypothetical protein WBQ72_10535 [Terriglobales bacterium]|jgi:hypothetical protein
MINDAGFKVSVFQGFKVASASDLLGGKESLQNEGVTVETLKPYDLETLKP